LYHFCYSLSILKKQPSPNWDIDLPPIDGPLDAEAIPQCSDRQAADVVASQLEGAARWTLRLLADQMIELGYVDCVSHVTVREWLKRTGLSLGG
jgi:hypothetical protein